MEVDGGGSIAVSGGQASFNLSASHGKKNKIIGNFSYNDPAAGLNLNASKFSSFFITGNHAQVSGTAKMGKHGKITFTVDVYDNGPSGDQFFLSTSSGYSAGGTLTSGNILIH